MGVRAVSISLVVELVLDLANCMALSMPLGGWFLSMKSISVVDCGSSSKSLMIRLTCYS